MRKITVIVLSAILVLAVAIGAAEWKVDRVHSSVQFSVSHMTISKVKGQFDEFSGQITGFDGKSLTGGSVEFNIEVSSVDTDNENRDGHLKSDDFFNVESYPKITFKSKKIVPGEGKKFKLVGDMTMRDVTKEVTFDCEYNGSVPGRNGRKAGFSAETSINRHDFNVAFNRALEGGGLVVGNDVKLSLELEFNEVVPEEEAKG